MVQCSNCKEKFEALFDDDSGQAYACSAVIHETSEGGQCLVGYYGSFIIDGDVYLVLTDKYNKNDNVCDECVKQGISNKEFEILSSNNYFEIAI
jgi:hypothetical protein